jgi:transposase
MKKGPSKVTFKPYTMDQLLLLPNLEELIPEDHVVHVVNLVNDELYLERILNEYIGDGTGSSHPRMMLKVLVYTYILKVNSSRQITKVLWENVNFMWMDKRIVEKGRNAVYYV